MSPGCRCELGSKPRVKAVTMESRFPSLAMPHARRARARLVNDLRTLARDAEHLVEATAEDVSEKAGHARERLSSAVERLKETCEELQERSLASARAAVEETDRAVRSHPYQSIGVAFGVGFLVGYLMRRR